MKEDITLNEIFTILKSHFIKIVLWGLLGVALSSAYTFFLVTPQYQSTSKIVVNQTQNSGNSITNNDIQTNLNLINTYQSIILEPIILEDVIENTKSELSISQLSEKISIQTQSNSLVFGVTVTDENPYTSSEISNAIAESFEAKIGNILEVESVTILSQAEPNLNPVSPNTILNLIVGIILGMLFGTGIAFLSEFMDKRVKDNKIIDDLGWTNLGSIIEMSISEVKDTRINGKRIVKDSITRAKRRV